MMKNIRYRILHLVVSVVAVGITVGTTSFDVFAQGTLTDSLVLRNTLNGRATIQANPATLLVAPWSLTLPPTEGTTGSILFGTVVGNNSTLSWLPPGIDGQVLTLAGGVPIWTGSPNWQTLGNAGLNAAVNFLGTTDAVDLVFRANNEERVRTSVSTFGGTAFTKYPTVGSSGGYNIISTQMNLTTPITFSDRSALVGHYLQVNPGAGNGSGNTGNHYHNMARLWTNGANVAFDDFYSYAGILSLSSSTTGTIADYTSFGGIIRPAGAGGVIGNYFVVRSGSESGSNPQVGNMYGLWVAPYRVSGTFAGVRVAGANDRVTNTAQVRDFYGVLVDTAFGTNDNYAFLYRPTDVNQRFGVNNLGFTGIGDVSFTAKLSVLDVAARTTDFTTALVQNQATSSTNNRTKYGLRIENSGAWSGVGSVNTGLLVQVAGGATNYAALFSGGDVGIGTLTPVRDLHVAGVAGTPNVRIESVGGVAKNTRPAGFDRWVLADANGDLDNVEIGVGIREWAWSLTGNGGTNPATNFLGTSDPVDFVLRTSNTERLRVTSGGNVGIGTAAASQLLEIEDGNVLISTSGAGTAGQLRFEEDAANGNNYFSLQAAASMAADNNYTWPPAFPTGANFVLSSTVAGVMSWADVSTLVAVSPFQEHSAGQFNIRRINSLNNLAPTGLGQYGMDLAGSRSAAGRTATGQYSLVVNGNNGLASNQYSTVINGDNNTSSGQYSLLGSGQNNTASGQYSVLMNGTANTSSGQYAFLGGGSNNTASAGYSIVVGGDGNSVNGGGFRGLIVGGQGNTVTGNHAVIVGGATNQTSSNYGFIGAGQNNSMVGNHAVITGGSGNSNGSNFGFVGAGQNNSTTSNHGVVVGGNGNTQSANLGFIGGGQSNTMSGNMGVVVGGQSNTTSGDRASILGGNSNSATGSFAVVAGGSTNTAGANYTAVLGGSDNVVNNQYGFILGGRNMQLTANDIVGFNLGSQMNIGVSNTFAVGNANLWLANNSGSSSELRFYEPTGTSGGFPPANVNYVSFRAPIMPSTNNNTYTLPAATGSAGQVLGIAAAPAPNATTATLEWTTITAQPSVETFNVNANNTAIAQAGTTTFLRLISNGLPAFRRVTIADGTTQGHVMVIRAISSSAAVTNRGVRLLDADANLELSGNVNLNDGDTITLIWDGGVWYETARRNN